MRRGKRQKREGQAWKSGQMARRTKAKVAGAMGTDQEAP
jgi:hypothetical protein